MALIERGGSLLLGDEHFGEVALFDGATGLGLITLEDANGAHGSLTLGFHCTQIAGGRRVIAKGTKVRFTVISANLGLFEASNIEPR